MNTDTQRMDWMAANPTAIRIMSIYKPSFGRKVWFRTPYGADFETLREAIDCGIRLFPITRPSRTPLEGL